jgi:basic membrane protein A
LTEGTYHTSIDRPAHLRQPGHFQGVDLKQAGLNFLRQLGWAAALVLLLYGLSWLGQRAFARPADGARLRAALFINGTLGDKSFFDSAARGMAQARQSLPVYTRVIEGGTDPTRWEGALTDLADSGDYDVIIAGTFTMVPYVQKLAPEFPAVRFIVFDAAVDYSACRCANVYSMLFRQNEGAYLAGYLAARLMRQGLPDVAPGSALGVVGGMQFPVIEDFIVGFDAGANAATPGVKVLSQYANAFSDPAAGKEIAKSQFGQGAGLIFHAAGATGQGVNEAADEARRYAIGVDMDQYALYRDSNPRRASRIVTSVLKDVDAGLVRAIRLQLEGRLAYGRAESIGLAEGGIRLARHSAVLDAAPAALLRDLDAQQAAIADGRIRVPSAFAAVPSGR